MKRLAFAILVVTAVAASAFVVLNRPGADASPDVTITVNSASEWVTPDNELTLHEAMALANGSLPVGALTAAECFQVSGAVWVLPSGGCDSSNPPGASSADTIVFDTDVFPPGSPATISVEYGPLPALRKHLDTLDGSGPGVIVDGGGTDAFDCFEITSDYNTIKGMEIYNCRYGACLSAQVATTTPLAAPTPEMAT